MSSHRLSFTLDARRDIRGILRYTRTTWGVRQRDIYSRQLRAAFDQLTQFPELGERQEFLPTDIRARRIGQHVIYYQVEPEVITVVRVLHSRMNAEAQYTS